MSHDTLAVMQSLAYRMLSPRGRISCHLLSDTIRKAIDHEVVNATHVVPETACFKDEFIDGGKEKSRICLGLFFALFPNQDKSDQDDDQPNSNATELSGIDARVRANPNKIGDQ
jgi:hypothetical protein